MPPSLLRVTNQNSHDPCLTASLTSAPAHAHSHGRPRTQTWTWPSTAQSSPPKSPLTDPVSPGHSFAQRLSMTNICGLSSKVLHSSKQPRAAKTWPGVAFLPLSPCGIVRSPQRSLEGWTQASCLCFQGCVPWSESPAWPGLSHADGTGAPR